MLEQSKRRKPLKNYSAFTFCNILSALVCPHEAPGCTGCQSDHCYLVDQIGVVRKRRALAKLQEDVSELNRPSSFTLVSHDRTAKHYKGARKLLVVDSGASISTTSSIDNLHSVDNWHPNTKVQVANKQFVTVICTGTMRLTVQDKHGKPLVILLRNVHYSPDFSHNLLSTDELYRQHGITTKLGGHNYLKTPNKTRIPIAKTKNQYQLHAYQVTPAESALLWHRRLMHIGTKAMQNMQSVIPSLNMQGVSFQDCDACLQGGSKRQPMQPSPPRPREASRKHPRFTAFGQRIASDLCGPFETGLDGELYAINFVDTTTKYTAVYCIPDKTKETVLAAFQRFLSDHHAHLPNGVGHFWTDGGGEYLNSEMDKFCEEICIRRNITVPYNPQQNPYAERTWGTLLRKVRTCMAESGIPDKFWPYAIQQAALIHNVVVDENGMSPYYRLHGEHFDYSKLHAFGCLCYYLLPDRDRESKLSPTALPAIYLGTDQDRNGHHLHVPDLQRTTAAYHVVFNEHRFYSREQKNRVHFDASADRNIEPIGRTRREYIEQPADGDANQPDQHNANDDAQRNKPVDDPRHGDSNTWNDQHCENSECLYPRGHNGPCSHEEVHSRFRPLPRRIYAECAIDDCVYCAEHAGPCVDSVGRLIGEFEHACGACDVSDDDSDDDLDGSHTVIFDDVSDERATLYSVDPAEPSSFKQATSGPLAERWWESMREEIEALLKNETWKLISRNDPRLKRRAPTKSRWVYKVKTRRDGTVERLKSRFVVCGYSQRQGLDYDRAFSATMRASSFRTLLAIAAGKKLRLVHFDVSNAFTQANLDDVDLFVEPPPGFEQWETIDGKRVSKLLHLKRALYGSKQASRLWQETLCDFLEDKKRKTGLAFKRSTADPCVFHLQHGVQEIVVGIYVDDIVAAYKGDALFKSFSEKFQDRFTSRFEGDLHWFLGIAVDQKDDFSVAISHEQSISKMCDKYIPNNSVTRECPPTELFNKLDKASDDLERARVQQFPYASIVGALLYISVMTRPDCAFHTSVLAKFLSDPSEDCCKACTQLLQYLWATKDRKMVFNGDCSVPPGLSKHAEDVRRNHGFVAYSDSSWGNKYPYPMFGYGIYLFGGLVSFGSKQLKTVAFSSCEAEYAAAAYCCKEIEFIRNLCHDLGVILHGRLVLAVDNTACIDVAHDVGVSARTKHFDRAIHYLRDLTQLRRVLPTFVSTEMQRADGYTKSLDKSKYFTWLRQVFPV